MNKKNKNAKLPDETFMKDDPLEFLIIFLHLNMSHHMIYINAIKCFIVLYLQLFNVVGIVYILKDETHIYFQKYIPLILGQQVGIICYVLHIFYTTTILHLADRIKMSFLPLNSTSRRIQKKILGEYMLIKKILTAIFVLNMIMCGSFSPLVGDEEDIEFTVMFIKQHFSVWPNFFLGLYYLCHFSLGYSCTSMCGVYLYIILHLKFQFYLLTDRLKRISSGFNPKNEDAFYQDLIRKRLKSFVQVHNKIKKTAVLLLDLGKWSVILLDISAVLLYTALVYSLYMRLNPSSNFRYIFCLIVTTAFTYIFLSYGEDLRNESFNLYTSACQCKWTDWNVQNRRTLLTIIMNTSKEMKFTSFGIIDLGHEILVHELRITYSMVLLLLSLNK